MEILTDVDGVLLDWVNPFKEWMRQKGHPIKISSSYDINEWFPSLGEKAFPLVEEFNASANMGFLPALKDSIYWVKHLHEYYGVTLNCISSMGNDRHAKTLREQNLKRLFGENVISRVTILGCGADKKEALTEYKDSKMVWLEDNIHNANVGHNLGLRSYLFNRPWNKNISGPENFTRLSGWEDFVKFTRLYQ